ncbi:MAG: hypothetical protein JSU61_01525 [Fidelibacterota bacterium]|nr:MAG: hypothetical protein JSU61_01525 [Candidatus Neomarinimicrobiota bacterium]
MNNLRILSLFISVVGLLFFGACEDFIQDVDPIIDEVENDLLDDAGQFAFLANGVRIRFATAHDLLGVQSDGLSDAFEFDQSVPNATYPSYDDIDDGTIETDNNSVDGAYNNLGELRFFADNLVERADAVEADAADKDEAYFVGYLYGGIARYFYASYFGLEVGGGGGGVIDNGPFIAAADMYDDAVDKLEAALAYATDEEARIINSLIARIYLFKGEYSNAAGFAVDGMIEGDDPFESQHSPESANQYWQQAGIARTQFVVANRFRDYIDADPLEAARIPIDTIRSEQIPDSLRDYQVKYTTNASPIPVITWQENELMLAELALRGQTAAGDALTLVNNVRASHGLADLTAVDLDVIYEERDKELFVQGNRLIDQRRFNDWHLPAGRWKYLPITNDERNNNPNI